MSDAHETDEMILKIIVKRNSTRVQENDFLDVIIYYKSPKTLVDRLHTKDTGRSFHIMKNKPGRSSTLKLTNVFTILDVLLKTAGFNLMSTVLHWLHDNNFKSTTDHASKIWSHQLAGYH